MPSFATWSGLAAGCVALAALAPAAAQSEPTLSKPLNLSEFAKASAAKSQAKSPARSAAKPSSAPRPLPDTNHAAAAKTAAPLLAQASASAAKAAPPPSPGASEAAPAAPPESDAAKFCSNIADAALDARVAWQQKELQAAEDKLRQRIAELEAKRAEYEQWLKLREEFLKKAEDSVVEIYSRMEPEAAALQIASMADDTAAAVLAKLRVRNASAILNEMEPARGARLADTLAGMRRADDGNTRK
ncbi:MAG TPA: MotE family protein [Rhodopseudomonas sp.]|uniref:MotE family protein n=1 Tax=Rhodopseudomonas sp. TaxID=1078 RepID=UPI002EDA6272